MTVLYIQAKMFFSVQGDGMKTINGGYANISKEILP